MEYLIRSRKKTFSSWESRFPNRTAVIRAINETEVLAAAGRGHLIESSTTRNDGRVAQTGLTFEKVERTICTVDVVTRLSGQRARTKTKSDELRPFDREIRVSRKGTWSRVKTKGLNHVVLLTRVNRNDGV
jgi:hypothetical protein